MDRKGIFIAGSDMNAGKTTLSLGLISWLEENIPGGVSFMKPMGQKTVLRDGESVGEDTFLVNTSLGLEIPSEYSAPFTMSSGAAQKYLTDGNPSDLDKIIRKAYRRLRSDSEIVVVEGTGHPGVGSVFDLCNASVAKLLDIPVLMVLDGGIGRTIDRYTLCSSLFREHDVPILGVVVNRVLESKIEKVRSYLDPWFQKRGIPVFGYIPFQSSISEPSIGMLGRELGFQAQDGEIEGFIAGFGSTREILERVSKHPRRALLLSSSREEVLDAILARRLTGSLSNGPGAVVLCGSSREESCMVADGFEKMDIPLYRTKRSADDSVSLVNRRVFKVEPGESVKISEIVSLIKTNVDIDAILNSLQAEPQEGMKQTGRPVSRLRSWFSRLLGGR